MPARASWGLTRRGITRFFGKTVKTRSVKHTLPSLTVAAVLATLCAIAFVRESNESARARYVSARTASADRSSGTRRVLRRPGDELLRQAPTASGVMPQFKPKSASGPIYSGGSLSARARIASLAMG